MDSDNNMSEVKALTQQVTTEQVRGDTDKRTKVKRDERNET